MSTQRPLDELFASALDQPDGPDREAWITQACQGDESLERELREMLSLHATGSWFMPGPYRPEAEGEADGDMPAEIGPFRIEGEIGRGGMGVVYRAIDTRLDRTVAIKSLPSYMATDARRLARFEQEAKTLATLNHPNVAAIHGLEEHKGRTFLILEHVDGLTLAEQIRKGPLPVDEAVAVCAQIAAGMAAAHDAGVIHRDLKPANVKITPTGEVKVLDFGLAKATAAAESPAAVPEGDADSPSPPESPVQTIEGAVLGTAAYMSPEQARGRAVDHRTDVWSFGVVLHECLTGACYFRTTSAADSIQAILSKPISYEGLPTSTSPVLRHVLQRCLERDRSKRFRDMHDVRLALEHDASTMDASFVGMAPSRKLPIRWLMIAAVVLMAVALAIGFFSGRGTAQPMEVARPIAHFFTPALFADRNPMFDISPDGQHVAYRGRDGQPDGPPAIFVRDLGATESTRLPGSEHASGLSYSPDGSQIAFFWQDPTSRRTQLRVLDLDGGEPIVVLTDTEGKRFQTHSAPGWFSSSHLAIHEHGETVSIYRVPVDLGAGIGDVDDLEVYAQLDPVERYRRVFGLVPVPGRDYLLLSQMGQTSQMERYSILRVDDDGTHLVLDNASHPNVTRDGQLLFVRDGAIHGAPFDIDSGTVVGEPIKVARDVQVGFLSTSRAFDYADNGTLVVARWFRSDSERRIMTIRTNGERTPLAVPTAAYTSLGSVSPDGREVVVSYEDQLADASRMRVVTIETGAMRTVPPPPDGARMGTSGWTADGRVSFTTFEGPGDGQIYVEDAAGTTSELLLGGPDPIGLVYSPVFTADGRHVIFSFMPRGDSKDQIQIMPLDGTMQPVTLVMGGEQEAPLMHRLSPDERWLAYSILVMDAGRSPPRVVIQPFDHEADRSAQRLTIENAVSPFWAADSSTLYYLEHGTRDVMAVDIRAEPDLEVSAPRRVLDQVAMHARQDDSLSLGVEVLRDGRFLYLTGREDAPRPHLHFILNVDAEIQRQLASANAAAED